MTPVKTLGRNAPLARALEIQRERLMPCVHCGFCLPACPTYNRLGDEADSPRGRLHLMRAVVDGRLDPGSDAFRTHIDRCLGCRACEPVCPSGVEYGSLLELARDVSARSTPPAFATRFLLGLFRTRAGREAFFLVGRALRATGLASFMVHVLPRGRLLSKARMGLAMVAATRRWNGMSAGAFKGHRVAPPAAERRGLRIGLLVGCVQEGLYARVNAATVRVLKANGYEVVPVAGQTCCGALHAHGGDLDEARALARTNIRSFTAVGVDRVAVNAAGCGASMKEYGDLLADDPDFAEEAERFSKRVRDVSELLAEAGPRRGAEVTCTVAYDHPCHLLHAQGIREEPLTVLAAVPGLEVRVVENAAECCGGAGIYALTHPELGGSIGGDKVAAVRRARADVVATPNPGCMMQIGAGLHLEGAPEGVVHPVELLDESYRRAGFYVAE
jgi:glycolate oxidase iron-sulfur subunit